MSASVDRALAAIDVGLQDGPRQLADQYITSQGLVPLRGLCWRCDSKASQTEVGLCKPCREDLCERE